MFSVLIPVFNHSSFLHQAVESAVRDPLVGEVLLVDDGSRDGSQRVIQVLCQAYAGRVSSPRPKRSAAALWSLFPVFCS